MSDGFYFPILWLVVGGLALGFLVVSNGLASVRRRVETDAELCEKCENQLPVLVAARGGLRAVAAFLTAGGLAAMVFDSFSDEKNLVAERAALWPKFEKEKIWKSPDWRLAETDSRADLIEYGRDLVANTQDFFGENGTVRPHSINAMNCQNCHLEAGAKPFGNNYAAVFSTYPQKRARSGQLETMSKRVNDCFQRSLNGQPLDSTSREMRAFLAYFEFLGTGIPKNEKPKGAGLVEVPFLDRAADPVAGQKIYAEKCASCHADDGSGLKMPDRERRYPPLWGEKSYNEGAGLFRLSRFAGYVKANMPFGATFENPQLTNAEAWDVAAFVNSQPRPRHPFLATDWPKIEKKPFDHPFGPFADPFSEAEHKFGPFGAILDFYKK